MADRWTHDRGRSEESRRQRFEPDYSRDRWGSGGGYDYGAGGARGQEERSFRSYDNDREEERSYRSYGGQGERSYGERSYGDSRVFGERESGASYSQSQGGYGGQGYDQGRYGGQGGRYYGDTGGRSYEGSRFGEEPRFGGYERDYGRRTSYASQGGGDASTGYESDRYRGGARDWSTGDAGYSRYAGGHRGREDDRGFFERAGERISSWFSDDDDDRRQRGRHYGRGPSGYKRSDARISEDIHDRLTDHDDLDASTIQVQVKDGEVTLTGTVAEREDKHRAERLAERVTGVDHVQNNLRVDPSLRQTGSHLFGGSFARDEQNARSGRQGALDDAPDQVKAVSDGKN